MVTAKHSADAWRETELPHVTIQEVSDNDNSGFLFWLRPRFYDSAAPG